MGDDNRSCDRARAWVSADLDGELSEIERVFLRRHVARCDACETHVRRLAAAIARLRFAALEQPDLPPFTVPSRRRSLRTVQAAAAAAAVAAAAGLGAALGVQPGPAAPARAPTPSLVGDVTDQKLVSLSKTYLRRPQAAPPVPQ